jgi:hypothetical protein
MSSSYDAEISVLGPFLYYFGHLNEVDPAVPVHVVHAEKGESIIDHRSSMITCTKYNLICGTIETIWYDSIKHAMCLKQWIAYRQPEN